VSLSANRVRATAALLRLAVLAIVVASAATRAAERIAERSIGAVDFPVSCAAATAPAFNHAVALLHHMTYPQARAAFVRIVEIDPTCGMAHWGVAMTLFQPLWPNRPGPPELDRGWREVQEARALAPTEREQLFIAAAAGFFVEPAATDYWARIRRWEEGMRAVHEAYPRDPEATAFYALAILASAPADTADSTHSARAAALLHALYQQHPDHPGAMHYLIHADDVRGRESEDLPIVHAYENAAPDNPHALHMPTHIYTRLGDWEGVVRGNLRAAEAALAFPGGEHGELVSDEFPHAIEYLVYAYLQQGADRQAAAQVARLQRTADLEPTFKTAFHTASIPARYALERHAWREAAQCVPRQPSTIAWDRFPWPEAVMWFERGLGAAHEGDLPTAEAALDHIEALQGVAGRSGETLFRNNIAVLRHELAAWIAQVRGDAEAAVARLHDAAELEAATPKHAVTPGPTLPALELLGDLLLEQGRAQDALIAYRESLDRYPRRFNSLLGAARAARMAKQDGVARGYYRELLTVATGADRARERGEAQSFR
jgi:tetratricopeptide (TPR) repeat protein